MPCLGHDRRFKSVLQAVSNELRKQEQLSTSTLRTIARQCCSCHNNESDTVDLVAMNTNDDNHQWMKIQNLYERIKKIEPTDNQLIRSFNQLEKLIRENRIEVPMVFPDSTPIENNMQQQHKDRRRSSSASSMSDSESKKPKKPEKKPKKKKHSKKIKQGTFIFLPFTVKTTNQRKNTKEDALVQVAKSQQLKRFLGRTAHFGDLAKMFNVQINMIAENTSAQITEALENAKNGMENLKIYQEKYAMNPSKTESGVWVLVRPKKKVETVDVNKVLEEINTRWDNCLTIRKRGIRDDSSDDDDYDARNNSRLLSKRR